MLFPRSAGVLILLVCVPCFAADKANRRSLLNANGRGAAVTHEYQPPVPTKPTHEDFVRWAHNMVPARMTSAQLDPSTGLLAWPRALLSNEYADLRGPLDRMMSERAKVGGAAVDDLESQIEGHIQQMTNRLAARIRQMRGVVGTKNYIEARNFLRSLEYEMGFAPGTADDN